MLKEGEEVNVYEKKRLEVNKGSSMWWEKNCSIRIKKKKKKN